MPGGLRGLLNSPPGILLAECLSIHLEVAVRKGLPAISAAEAIRMILAGAFVLEILPFDARAATAAQATVEKVIVLLTVRLVIDHIEGGA
jgi:hypothetical protein